MGKKKNRRKRASGKKGIYSPMFVYSFVVGSVFSFVLFCVGFFCVLFCFHKEPDMTALLSTLSFPIPTVGESQNILSGFFAVITPPPQTIVDTQ